jgi:hypothetical protein
LALELLPSATEISDLFLRVVLDSPGGWTGFPVVRIRSVEVDYRLVSNPRFLLPLPEVVLVGGIGD